MSEVVTHIVPVPKLPKSLTQAAHAAIRCYAVSMLASSEDEQKVQTCSGTFVVLNSRPRILTARHVWNEVRKFPRLILMIGGVPFRLESRYLESEPIPVWGSLKQFDVDIPDLAFIPLTADMKGTIEARGNAF